MTHLSLSLGDAVVLSGSQSTGPLVRPGVAVRISESVVGGIEMRAQTARIGAARRAIGALVERLLTRHLGNYLECSEFDLLNVIM